MGEEEREEEDDDERCDEEGCGEEEEAAGRGEKESVSAPNGNDEASMMRLIAPRSKRSDFGAIQVICELTRVVEQSPRREGS